MARSNPVTLAVTLCAAALLVTSCSAGPIVSVDPNADPNVAETDAPAEPEVVTPTQCVIGTWQVDNAAFESWMNSLVVSVPVQMAVSGSSYMRFDDQGTFFTWRDDFTFTTTAEGQTVTHISNSGETGDYGLVLNYGTPPTVDFLWIAETMRVMHDEMMIVGGIATLIDDGGAEARIELFDGYTGAIPTVEGEPLEGSLPFTCDDDTLVFEFDAGLTMPFNRTTATP